MNRYKAGGPTKATATTLCQKCLQKGHYSYECSAASQERPYTSRPSRTQQLLNPKLAPKIREPEPSPLLRTQMANTPPGKSNLSGGTTGAGNRTSTPRQSRSVSSFSSGSVSTISTNNSRSRSRRISVSSSHHDHEGSRQNRRSPTNHAGGADGNSRSASRSPITGPDALRRKARERSRSRSPQQADELRYRERSLDGDSSFNRPKARAPPSSTKRLSLSPFSARLALTNAMKNA